MGRRRQSGLGLRRPRRHHGRSRLRGSRRCRRNRSGRRRSDRRRGRRCRGSRRRGLRRRRRRRLGRASDHGRGWRFRRRRRRRGRRWRHGRGRRGLWRGLVRLGCARRSGRRRARRRSGPRRCRPGGACTSRRRFGLHERRARLRRRQLDEERCSGGKWDLRRTSPQPDEKRNADDQVQRKGRADQAREGWAAEAPPGTNERAPHGHGATTHYAIVRPRPVRPWTGAGRRPVCTPASQPGPPGGGKSGEGETVQPPRPTGAGVGRVDDCFQRVRPSTPARARRSRISWANLSGLRDWGPSDSASSGRWCTSINKPSAPHAIPAFAMGATYSQ